jgi:hypothetical protein
MGAIPFRRTASGHGGIRSAGARVVPLHRAGQRTETAPCLVRPVWIMDRGIPPEAVLAEMRASDPPVQAKWRVPWMHPALFPHDHQPLQRR